MTTLWMVAGVLAGLFLTYVLLLLLAYLFERRPLHTYVPLALGERAEASPYSDAMNAGAVAAEFADHGVFQHCKGGTYRVWAWLWMSPSRDILALVCSGRLLRLRVRRTLLYTALPSGGYFVSADEAGEPDLSGIYARRMLLYADFPALLAFHRDRVEAAGQSARPFSQSSALQAHHAIEETVANRLVERGYARFADPAGQWFRFTLRGALKCTPRMLMLPKEDRRQTRHVGLARPGDPGYAARIPTEPEAEVEGELGPSSEDHAGPPNISFRGASVRFRAASPYLLFFDPLASDAIREYLQQTPLPEAPTPSMLGDLFERARLRIGRSRIEPFEPGEYELSVDSFVAQDPEEESPECFWIDSGTLIVADFAHLRRIVEALSWERYDWLLRSPLGDYSRFAAITDEVGGPHYAILSGDVDTAFPGDGTYRLKPGAVRRAEKREGGAWP